MINKPPIQNAFQSKSSVERWVRLGFKVVPFDEVFEDYTKYATKLKYEEYLSSGKYSIIDQGKEDIAGYSNNQEGVFFTDSPVIIFGDHTKIIKYVNPPIFLGADGTKLLKPITNNVNVRYLFYFLKSINLPDAGYSRHFKYLKQVVCPIPPNRIQNDAAAILDRTSDIVSLRKKQLEELDNLIQSVFYDMFGDPVTNEKRWKPSKLKHIGILNSGGTPPRIKAEYFLGDIDWYTAGELNTRYLVSSVEKISEEAIKDSSAKLFKKGSLLIGMYDTAAFKLGILQKDASSNQACANININRTMCNIEWLYSCLYTYRPFILNQRRGIRQQNLNLGMIRNIEVPIPPLPLQNQFATIVEKIEEQKALVQKALEESHYLFESLMDRYFGD